MSRLKRGTIRTKPLRMMHHEGCECLSRKEIRRALWSPSAALRHSATTFPMASSCPSIVWCSSRPNSPSHRSAAAPAATPLPSLESCRRCGGGEQKIHVTQRSSFVSLCSVPFPQRLRSPHLCSQLWHRRGRPSPHKQPEPLRCPELRQQPRRRLRRREAHLAPQRPDVPHLRLA